MLIVDHIKFVLNEKIELIEKTSRTDYDEGYLDALDFVLNLIEEEVSLWVRRIRKNFLKLSVKDLFQVRFQPS